jgi:uncharacterized Zn finger protein (UPF0148 family)
MSDKKMNLQLINDLTPLYDDIREGTMTCPFCDKEYKQVRAFEKHMGKAIEEEYACAKPIKLFKDTFTEENAVQYYIDIMNLFYKKPVRASLHSFRGSKMYASMCEYTLFTMEKHISSLEYMRFVFRQFKKLPKAPGVILKVAKEESMVTSYFKFKRHHQDWIKSDDFYEGHKEYLETDDRFLMKSLRRGDVSFEFSFSHLNLRERYTRFDLDLQVQMEELLDEDPPT